MITHGNIVATAAAVMTVIPKLDVDDIYIAYLPLAHIFELASEVAFIFVFASLSALECYNNLHFFLPVCNVYCRLCHRLWISLDLNGHLKQSKEGHSRRCFCSEANSYECSSSHSRSS